jgi:hypothetical protein
MELQNTVIQEQNYNNDSTTKTAIHDGTTNNRQHHKSTTKRSIDDGNDYTTIELQ